jgi:OOP family OmpA-OmpF porin
MVLDWLQQQKPLTFRPESANLSDNDRELIAEVVETVKRCPSAEVLIEGHTSRVGDDAFNQELSEKRALAVHQAVRDAGIGEGRLKAVGFGEAYPRVPGDDATLNRRIEINLEWNASRA